MNSLPSITVAAGILYSPDGRILLAERPPKRHLEGWWEFPGGKLEADETPHLALQRELREELGIEVLASRPFMTIRHAYPDRIITLLVREVLRYQGEPHGAEGQAVAWAGHDELLQWDILPADKPILQALLLPHQYLITPPLMSGGIAAEGVHERIMAGLRDALQRGMQLVQLRVPGMPAAAMETLAREAVVAASQAGARLLVNEDWELARRVGAHGVHLKAEQLSRLTQRPSDLELVAASTHNVEEIRLARELNCDFVCLGPVRRTASHPQATPLNWRGFGELAQEANLPVFALGGVTLDDFDQAREAGAVGISGIRGFWRG